LRKDDAELKEEINKALRQLVSSGKIAAILGHYGVPFFPAK